MSLANFRTLGRSGLVVSPMALGTMTFGAERWGSSETGSRACFDAYVEAGGNFIDSADVYSGGRTDEMVGRFIAERKLRDKLVVASKAGFSREAGHPLAGGNGAKNIKVSLENSLRRLQTDYVDLFWIHVWDMVTPAEEVLQTITTLMRAGKILYYGISNAPAWYVAKLATLATAHGVPAPIALQYEYSLVERNIEREHVPMANDFGLGLLPWAPLGAGLLSGKYRRQDWEGKARKGFGDLPSKAMSNEQGHEPVSDGRLNGANPFGDTKFTTRNWQIVAEVQEIAREIACSPAQVALAWVLGKSSVASMIVGASRVEQLQENLKALEIRFTPEQKARLDEVSALEPRYPDGLFSPMVNRMVFGGQTVTGHR